MDRGRRRRVRAWLVTGVFVLGLLAVGVAAVAGQFGGVTVTVESTSSPVVAGETLQVTVRLENTGELASEQTVTLTVDGTERDSQTVVVDAYANRTVELTWGTASGEAGNYVATVAGADGSDSVDVSVLQPADFAVSIDETNAPVEAGEPLEVGATVRNTGGVIGTQNVTLSVGGSERDRRGLLLEAGESRTLTLGWNTTSGDVGEYTATVASADDSAGTAVAVTAPAVFEVSLAGTNAPILAGEELAVGARIVNTGAGDGTQDVVLRVDGTRRDLTAVPLEAGRAADVYFHWNSTVADDGAHAITVVTADDSAGTNVTVEPDSWVRFGDQRVADVSVQSVVVSGARLPDGGFLVVYDGPVSDGANATNVVGASVRLTAGEVTNQRISLDERLTASKQLYAVVHADTNDNNAFDFGDGTGADGAVVRDGSPVSDPATVDVVRDTPVPTETYTPTPTLPPITTEPTPSPTAELGAAPTAEPTGGGEERTDGGDGPGFGLPAGVVALATVGSLWWRRRA